MPRTRWVACCALCGDSLGGVKQRKTEEEPPRTPAWAACGVVVLTGGGKGVLRGRRSLCSGQTQ